MAIPFSRKDWPDLGLSFFFGNAKYAGTRSPFESKWLGWNRRYRVAVSGISFVNRPSSASGRKSSSSGSEMVPDCLKSLIVKVLKTVTKNFNMRFVVLAVTRE